MNKKLKSIEVGLIGCGDAVTLNASDTATEPIATYALDEFKAEQQMSFKDDGKEYFVPFHAVDHIYVSESETEVADRPNPYGCEPSGGGTDTYTVNFGGHLPLQGVKVGDVVGAPEIDVSNNCWWEIQNGTTPIALEQDKSFEFTQQMADAAVEGTVTFYDTCEG